MEKVGGVKKKGKRRESRYGKRYGFEFKPRCVKLRLEEGLPVALLSKEVGASRRPRTGIMEGWNIGTMGKLEYRRQASGGWQCQEYWKTLARNRLHRGRLMS